MIALGGLLLVVAGFGGLGYLWVTEWQRSEREQMLASAAMVVAVAVGAAAVAGVAYGG